MWCFCCCCCCFCFTSRYVVVFAAILKNLFIYALSMYIRIYIYIYKLYIYCFFLFCLLLFQLLYMLRNQRPVFVKIGGHWGLPANQKQIKRGAKAKKKKTTKPFADYFLIRSSSCRFGVSILFFFCVFFEVFVFCCFSNFCYISCVCVFVYICASVCTCVCVCWCRIFLPPIISID